jgi:hypothetical protein
MPAYIKKQTGFYGIVVRSVFYVFFYFIVLLIFIGDVVLSLFKPFINVLTSIFNIIRTISVPAIHKPSLKLPKKSLKSKKSVVMPSITSFKMKTTYFLIGALTALSIVFINQGYNFILSLPNPRLIGNVNFPVSTQIYDRNGVLLYDFYKDQTKVKAQMK